MRYVMRAQLCWMFFLKIIDDQDRELELTKDNYCSPIPANLQWRAWADVPEGITGDALLDFVNVNLFTGLKSLPTTAAAGDRQLGFLHSTSKRRVLDSVKLPSG